MQRKTLRVVAQHADVWNLPEQEPEEAIRLSRLLDEHCDAVGRDPAAVRRSVQLGFGGDVAGLVARAEPYAASGFTEFVVYVTGGSAEAGAETVAADALPQLQQLA